MTVRSLLAVVLVLSGAWPALALDITSCNTLVPDGEVGVLQTDMSCGGAFIAVGLGENATLDLNGHSITGTFVPDPPRAVECRGVRCTIRSSNGPGRIGGGDFVAVQIGFYTFNVARLKISDVELHDARAGLQGASYTSYPRDTRVKAERITADDNAEYGIWVTRLKGKDIDTSRNGTVGASADRLQGTNVTASDNGAAGLFGDNISVKNVVANDNGDCGVRAVRAAVKDGTLTGNDGFGMAIDLATSRRPRVRNTSCGKSQVLGGVAGQTWGVCTGD